MQETIAAHYNPGWRSKAMLRFFQNHLYLLACLLTLGMCGCPRTYTQQQAMVAATARHVGELDIVGYGVLKLRDHISDSDRQSLELVDSRRMNDQTVYAFGDILELPSANVALEIGTRDFDANGVQWIQSQAYDFSTYSADDQAEALREMILEKYDSSLIKDNYWTPLEGHLRLVDSEGDELLLMKGDKVWLKYSTAEYEARIDAENEVAEQESKAKL